MSDKLDLALRRQVKAILRHYPSSAEIQSEAHLSARLGDRGPAWMGPWLAPEEDQH